MSETASKPRNITHYFWTRIAVDAVDLDLNASREGRRSNEEIHSNICLWLQKASRFYELQTVNSRVCVVLQVSECYWDLVNMYPWPEWVELTMAPGTVEWAEKIIEPGAELTFSRLDADDSYSVDFIEMLEDFVRYSQPRLILHKQMRHYDVETRRLSRVLHHYSPMFATAYVPFWEPPEHKPHYHNDCCLTGVVGNHLHYHKHEHATSPGCFALQRFTGRNVASEFGVLGTEKVEVQLVDRRDPRFVGY